MEKNKEITTSDMTASALDDAQLIGCCISKERAARELLARECLVVARRLVYLVYGKRPDTEDVVQTALVAVFRDLCELKNAAAFNSWMYRVTCHVIYSHGARRSRLTVLFSLDPEMDLRPSFNESTPESVAIRTQLFDRLSYHLEKIKHKKRMAVILSLFFGHVDSEIGEVMGCSPKTAKKRVQHGRRALVKPVQKDPLCKGLIEEAAI